MSTQMLIGLIDYRLGNLGSVSSAVKRLGHTCLISCKADELKGTDKLILPGVGAFGDAMRNLKELELIEPLNDMVIKTKKPILGICLGSQLMGKESFEFGHNEGLGWIEASVERLKVGDLSLPHVGWNELMQVKDDPLFKEIPEDALFYYVHSFCVHCKNSDIVIGECEYGERFAAAFHHDNIYATQFHPEKSQLDGLNLLKNFLENS